MGQRSLGEFARELFDEFHGLLALSTITSAVQEATDDIDAATDGTGFEQVERAAFRRLTETLVERARSAGVGAVWTGDHSATVQLARLAGEHDGWLSSTHASRLCLAHPGPWQLSTADVRTVLYEYCLTAGSQFDVYRWVNLIDLAAILHRLRLPVGVRHEWIGALSACGLIP